MEKRKPAKFPQLVFRGTTVQTGSYWTGAERLELPTNGFGDRYSTIELRPYAGLLCFFVQHVLTHERIILGQFKTRSGVTAVLECVIHMAAFAAAKLDQDAIAFFSHGDALSYGSRMPRKAASHLTSL